jgi:TolA-binding protein
MNQLPGGFSPQYSQPPATAVPRLATMLIIWVVLAVGYGLYRMVIVPKQSAAVATTQPASTNAAAGVATASVQDWMRHVDDAIRSAVRTDTQLRALEARVRRLRALTDSSLQARQLESALGNLTGARLEVERTKAELEFIHQSLKGETPQ